MAVKRYPKRKKKSTNIPMILAGLILILIAFSFALQKLSQPSTEPAEVAADSQAVQRQKFIETLAHHAQELQTGYGILPSIILGQACLESNFGQSQLASEYKNLFGIKAFGNEPKVKLETQEYFNDQWVTINGEFRVYDNWDQSMDDHTQLFITGVDWDPQKYSGVLTATDYKQAAQALQDAGYATDPGYAAKIIEVIEQYGLNKYDQ